MSNRVLIISPTPTHLEIGGNRSCILSYCEMLIKEGYELTYLWIANFDSKSEDFQAMEAYWGDRLYVYKKTFVHRVVEALKRKLFFKRTGYYNLDDFYPFGVKGEIKKIKKAGEYDAVLINYVFMSKLFKFFTKEKKVLFTHDAFSNKYQFTGSPWFSITPNSEQIALNRSDVILSIQEQESNFFSYLTRKSILTSYSYFQICDTPYVNNKNILYLAGSNSYNVESIKWYIENVHRRIVNADSEVKLMIGGSICKQLTSYEKEPGICLLGFVDDKHEFYKKGNIVINPTYNGTGLKIKSFEALAYGKVLISHPHCLEGIYSCDYDPFNKAIAIEEYVSLVKVFINNKNKAIAYKVNAVKYIEALNSEVSAAFKKALS